MKRIFLRTRLHANEFKLKFNNGLLSDAYGVRLIRLTAILVVIFGWAALNGWYLEPHADIKAFLLNMPRYMIAPFAALIGVAFLAARFVQDIYELESYSQALRYVLALIFDGPPYSYLPPSGLLQPSLTISEGRKKLDKDEINLIDQIGGPGWLYVETGNVVVLEFLDRKSRVLGAGLHHISRFEHIKDVISLEDQRWDASPMRAFTRDGFEIIVRDFQIGYRLASDQSHNGHSKRSLFDPYPFSNDAAQIHAYERSVNATGEPVEWGKAVQFRLDGAITDYINRSFLDQLTAPLSAGDDPRTEITRDITSPSTAAGLKNFVGAELLWHKIGSFDVEPVSAEDDDEKEAIRRSIKEQRLRAWLAQWTGSAAVIRARGTAEKLTQEEGGRAETTTVMLQSIMQALNENDWPDEDGKSEDEKLRGRDRNLWNIVLARTAQIMESLTSLYGQELDVPDFNIPLKGEDEK